MASDVAAALAELARVENCTQLVLGASRRSRWAELVRGSVINRVIRLVGPDRRARHLARADRRAKHRLRLAAAGFCRGGSPLPPPPPVAGWAIAVARPAAADVPARAGARRHRVSDSVLLLFLSARRRVGGGRRHRCSRSRRPSPAFLCANYYFTPPLPPLDDLRAREPARADRLPRRGRRRQRASSTPRPGARSMPRRAPRRRRDAGPARGQRAARRSARRSHRVRAVVVRARRRERARADRARPRGGSKPPPASASPASPRRPTLSQPLGDGVVLALVGGRLTRRRPPGAQRLRRAAHRGARARASLVGSRAAQATG